MYHRRPFASHVCHREPQLLKGNPWTGRASVHVQVPLREAHRCLAYLGQGTRRGAWRRERSQNAWESSPVPPSLAAPHQAKLVPGLAVPLHLGAANLGVALPLIGLALEGPVPTLGTPKPHLPLQRDYPGVPQLTALVGCMSSAVGLGTPAKPSWAFPSPPLHSQ